jgi:hypothetical protein
MVAMHVATAVLGRPGFLSYLTTVGRALAITATVYDGIKAILLLAAGIVAMCTKHEKRRRRVEIIRIVCRGWPWTPGFR